MDKFILECECRLRSHMAVLERVDDEIVMEFQLSPYLGFWARLRAAIGYILHPEHKVIWDCVLISPKCAERLKQFLENEEIK